MKKSFILFAAVSLALLSARDFDAKTFKLYDGASVEKGVLKLDGKKAYATVPGTEKIAFTAPGVTFACSVKPVYDTGKGDGNKMMDSYFSRPQAPFTFCRWGTLLSTRIINPKTGKYQIERVYAIPKAGTWSHIAFVFLPVAGKENTWQQLFYINGKKVFDKTTENFIPQSGTGPVELGKGWGQTWLFTGEISDVHIAQKALNANEISALVKKSRAAK